MTIEQRIAVINAEEAEFECRACEWLGEEFAALVSENPNRYACPECGSQKVGDYESNLYRVGYR